MVGKLILLIILVGVAHSEVTSFDYKAHGDDWKDLGDGDWTDCDPQDQQMNQQSPIQIDQTASFSNQSFLFSNFYPVSASVQYLNTTVYVKASSLGQIYTRTIAQDIIIMKATEVRFRSHAEHKIYNKFYDLEMQIFFQQIVSSARNQRLGLSFMFEVEASASNNILKSIKEAFNPQIQTVTTNLDFSTMLTNEQIFDFWYYEGSGTIPPCKNGKLKWIVSKKVLKMSQEERDFFFTRHNNEQLELDGNWRKIQPKRNNSVKFYHFSSS